jgi:hypothetical protein
LSWQLFVRAAKAADGKKIRRASRLVWVRLPPPAPLFLAYPLRNFP